MAENSNETWIPAEGDAMKDYLLGSKIGFGSTGYVHLIKKRNPDSDTYAVKLDETSSYINERSAYRLLGAVDPQTTYPLHVPRIYCFAKCGRTNATIMELMGPSLSNLFFLNAKRFSLKTILQIANQMIDCIEYVHLKGLIHRDIKPSNFVIGHHDKSRIFLIDYGLAMQYKDPITNGHVPFSNYRRRGTPAFMSLNVHKDCRPSRRDDMESMMYSLIYFLSPSLIKQEGAYRKHKEQPEKVICEGLPHEIENCLTNIRSLGATRKMHELSDFYSRFLPKNLAHLNRRSNGNCAAIYSNQRIKMNFFYKHMESSPKALREVLNPNPELVLLVPERNPLLSIVAFYEDEEQPIGLVTGFNSDEKELYVANLFTLEHRGEGVGTSLLTLYEKLARKKSFDKVSLIVFEMNTRAKGLYTKQGFAKVGNTLNTLETWVKHLQ